MTWHAPQIPHANIQPCDCAATATSCGAAEIAPAVCPICHGPRTERGCADSRRDVNIETAACGPERPQTEHRIWARNTTRAESSPYGQPAKSSICLIVHAIDR